MFHRTHDRCMRTSLAASGLALLLLALVACARVSASQSSTSNTRSTSMHEFALQFRPTRALTSDELPRRNAAARDWALARREDGTLRAASPLEDDAVRVTRDGATRALDARAVASVLIVEA